MEAEVNERVKNEVSQRLNEEVEKRIIAIEREKLLKEEVRRKKVEKEENEKKKQLDEVETIVEMVLTRINNH